MAVVMEGIAVHVVMATPKGADRQKSTEMAGEHVCCTEREVDIVPMHSPGLSGQGRDLNRKLDQRANMVTLRSSLSQPPRNRDTNQTDREVRTPSRHLLDFAVWSHSPSFAPGASLGRTTQA
jgi:hypothetical protein